MSDPLSIDSLPEHPSSLCAETSADTLAAGALPGVIPVPIPIPLVLNGVSGRYRGTLSTFELELRVDIDGTRPRNLVSGDFYSVSGGVKTYFGSLKSGPVTLTWAAASVTIRGTLSTTWTTTYNNFTVTIPRTVFILPRAAATITFSNAGGATGATYVCPFESIYFRTIRLEEDYEVGTSLFGSYNTGALPHGGTARTLDVISSYAEAGVQMVLTAGTNAVPIAAAGADAIWTNAELETAMHNHFSIVSDSPQWQSYLLGCKSKHELTTGGSTLFGIMFDYAGTSQRQGCAVFQSQINSYYGGAGTNDANRHMLYCYVHELGHSFNLLHSWDKSRPDSLSWMNYDWKYDQRNGAGSYWSNFAFQFDDLELTHVRHAFRNNVIMGGDNWATNAGFGTDEEPADITKPILENRSGLALHMSAKPTFALGEPVVVTLQLNLRNLDGVEVTGHLHPNFGVTTIAIKKPSGEVINYEPLAEHLCGPGTVVLTESYPSISESAYIGYGKRGHYFDQPGTYILRAGYHANSGAIIASADLKIRVKSPLSAEDDDIAELYLGEEQGRLFYLLGSDGPHLDKGNEALNTVLEKHAGHPLSVYAALVQGVNASRDFKVVRTDKSTTVRKHDSKRSAHLLKKVFDMTNAGHGVDRITLDYAMRKAAESQFRSGDKDAGHAILNDLQGFLSRQNLAPHEMTQATARIDSLLNR